MFNFNPQFAINFTRLRGLAIHHQVWQKVHKNKAALISDRRNFVQNLPSQIIMPQLYPNNLALENKKYTDAL